MKRTAFFISDGTGITAETLGQSLLAQFGNIDFRRLTRPYIDTVEKAIEANNQFKQKQIRPSKPNGFGRVTRKEELPDRFVNPPIEKENPEVQEEIARRLREYEANRRKEEV